MTNKGPLKLSPRESAILDFAAATRNDDVLTSQQDPEALIGLWARRFGGVSQPLSEASLNFDGPGGTIDVHLRLTHATQFDGLARLGLLNGDQIRARRRLRGSERTRKHWSPPSILVRALALFFLSEDRTLTKAHEIYSQRFPDDPLWDERTHYALIRQVEAEWGDLRTAA